jgi:hypothetical protein
MSSQANEGQELYRASDRRGIGGMVDGLKEVDVLGFLEIVGAKIQGCA